MSLNIKDPEAQELARELANYTGESMTHEVIVALRERKERVKKKRQKKATVEELMAIAASFHRKMKGPGIDHAEFLYDERGLPK